MSAVTGHQLAEAGAKQALDHAGYIWAAEAYLAFCYYAKTVESFMADDVRHFAYANGLILPPDNRAWGGVVNRAVKAGQIKRLGYAPLKSPNCHARPQSVWQWVGGV